MEEKQQRLHNEVLVTMLVKHWHGAVSAHGPVQQWLGIGGAAAPVLALLQQWGKRKSGMCHRWAAVDEVLPSDDDVAAGHLACGQGAALPLADESMDKICVMLNEASFAEAAWREWYRVLAPGGCIAFVLPLKRPLGSVAKLQKEAKQHDFSGGRRVDGRLLPCYGVLSRHLRRRLAMPLCALGGRGNVTMLLVEKRQLQPTNKGRAVPVLAGLKASQSQQGPVQRKSAQ